MSKLKVGIIGAGGIAREVHIPNYLKCNDKAEIVAISDIVFENAKEVAEVYGIPNTFSSYHEMFAKTELDSLIIRVTNKFNIDIIINELKKNSHFICKNTPDST